MTEAQSLIIRAAQVDITPKRPLGLFGRSGRAAVFHAVKSRLEANCILINDAAGMVAVVALDSLYPSQILSEAILEHLALKGAPLSADALLLVASHTHNAPALDETKPLLGPFDPEYLSYVADRIAACIASIHIAPVTPASIAHAQAPCVASVFRRRRTFGLDLSRLRAVFRIVMAPNSRVEIDQAVRVFVVSNDAGEAIAALWSWPCHAVSEPDALAISADFPGVVRDHLRKVLGRDALPVLYFPGFSGDIRPASTSWLSIHKSGKWVGLGPRFARPSEQRAETLRSALHASIDTALSNLRDTGQGPWPSTRAMRQVEVTDLREDCPGMAPITCTDWTIGPVTIKAVSAEVASGYSVPGGGDDPLCILTGCAQQVFGYIPMDAHLREGGYEVTGFAAGFSVAGTFRDEIEAKIMRLIGT